EYLIRKICYIYLDNIIIWLESKVEHIRNIRKVIQALCNKGLICLQKKTKLFYTKVKFLRHLITIKGTEADLDKRVKNICKFLRLLYYIVVYLLYLVEYTVVLSLFTSKDCNKAFKVIKSIVTSRECLTTIDYNLSEQIYITTNVSDSRTRAVLSVRSL
ncbi:uncharacterized protein FOMMEDRAFT_85561, partial [Fomitiporia mediterranea MF3/22]|uniref:uncharacterized protein n=1 Tax=Fomitiporia mediterranea (strain MF3/22) TaxID=694068 RepID=UPI0004407C82